MRKRVLVTGGAGFIGSHLCERLLADGHRVTAVDNYFTGNSHNIEHLTHNPAFRMVRHDISFPYFEEVDCIYNLACPSAPVYYMHDPVTTLKASLLGTTNIMELAKRMAARVVHVSSGKVYGTVRQNPVPEEYEGRVNPVGEESPYNEGKRAAETICTAYHNQFGTEIRIARLFDVYGPRMQLCDGKAMSGFICNALNNEPLTLLSDQTPSHCFLYIDDAIEALVRLMDTDGELTRPINIGSNHKTDIGALAEDIVNLCGSQSKVTRVNLQNEPSLHAIPDISYARQRLGWEPLVPIGEGLLRTIKYFNEQQHTERKVFAGLSWVEVM